MLNTEDQWQNSTVQQIIIVPRGSFGKQRSHITVALSLVLKMDHRLWEKKKKSGIYRESKNWPPPADVRGAKTKSEQMIASKGQASHNKCENRILFFASKEKWSNKRRVNISLNCISVICPYGSQSMMLNKASATWVLSIPFWLSVTYWSLNR